MSKPTDTFDTKHEIERRIRHERLDEPASPKGLVLVMAALAAAAVAAAMCEENFQEKDARQEAPIEQRN